LDELDELLTCKKTPSNSKCQSLHCPKHHQRLIVLGQGFHLLSLNLDSWRRMAQDWSDETPLSLKELIGSFAQMKSMPTHSPFLWQAGALAAVVKVDSDDEINDDMKNTKQ
jgi:hypothetical protein